MPGADPRRIVSIAPCPALKLWGRMLGKRLPRLPVRSSKN